MKANIDTINKYLSNNEEVLSTLFCTIKLGYISRPGILAATNKKLLFCADSMFGKGLKWEFEYSEISSLKGASNGITYGTVPFVPKITMFYQQEDFVIFTYFTQKEKTNELYNTIKNNVQK
jgi:hypothetical protein